MKTIIDYIKSDALEVPALLGLTWDVTDQYNYWFKAGNNPGIVLVAHVDTITRSEDLKMGTKSSPLELIINNGVIRAVKSVLGADDRAGCYAIDQLKDLGCSILLTNGEEAGGIGVKQFIKDHPNLLSDCQLFIEFDRKGIDEYVCYHEPDSDLVDLLTEFNLRLEVGTYSDVADLSDHYGIHHVNLSIGYYNQHTKSEYLDYNALQNYLIPKYRQLILKFQELNKNWTAPAVYGYDDFFFADYKFSSSNIGLKNTPNHILDMLDAVDQGFELSDSELAELSTYLKMPYSQVKDAVTYGYLLDGVR